MSDEYIDFSASIKKIKNIKQKIVKNPNTEYVLLGSIMILSFFIRTRNLKFLDGKYLLGLDPYYYLRQSTEILSYGKLPFPDLMRNAPFGIEKGFDLFPYFLAYFSKLMSIFGLNQVESHIIYPPIFMVISLIPLYFFVKLIFDRKIALLSVLLLSILPSYIFRTMSGFSDHESISMFFIFSALYFLARAETLKSNKKYLYTSFAAIFTFLMSITWGAYPFLFIIIGTYYLLNLFFTKFDFKNYLIFLVTLMIPFIAIKGINLNDFGFLFLILISTIVLINEKVNFEKKFKIPNIISVLFIVGVISLILIFISDSLSLSSIVNKLMNAGGTSKVDFTTSEAISTKVLGGNGYYSQFREFIFIALIGFALMVKDIFSKLNLTKKESLIISSIFSISITVVMLGNWSSEIILMKNNYLLFLFANFLFFMSYYVYLHKRHNSSIKYISANGMLLVISYFLVSGLLARTAVRFLFLLSPAIAILSAVAIVRIYKKLNFEKIYGYGVIIIASILIYSTFSLAYGQASNMGSSFPGQWETSMKWISSNTEEDSIIAHWWDYGYWTQYVGNRATVNDGGRPGGDLNMYTLARYGMLGDDRSENLEYFKSRNVSHLLYSSEEMMKYAAFSYIGSDITGDKKSQLGLFSLNEIKEIRSGTKLRYSGSWYVDSTIIEGNKLINPGSAIVTEISYTLDSDGSINSAPIIKLVANNFSKEYKIGCVYDGRNKLSFEYDLNYCIRIIPYIVNEGSQNIGGIILQSEKVHNSLFAKLYINGEKLEEYSLLYRDNTPLAIYNGRLIGPVSIWSINYSGSERNVSRFTDMEEFIKYHPKNGINNI